MVGEVHFVGIAPWEAATVLTDALVVESVSSALAELQEWQEDWEEDPVLHGPRHAVIAPDDYHKEDVSGGPPYGVALPNGTVDAMVENEWHQTTFVDYLRQSFICGGFPGLAREPRGLPEVVRGLATDLLPL